MASPDGFEWVQRKNGDVVISHHGHTAATLRGHKAIRFVEQVDSSDAQELMARLTGNYRRGNEGESRNHPRNQRR